MQRSTAIARLESESRVSTLMSERPRHGNPMTPRGPRPAANATGDAKADRAGDGAGVIGVQAGSENGATPPREHDRVRTNVRAVVYARTTFQSTVIRDLSLGGAGLSGAHGLFPGEPVTITLLNGASRSGVVRWWLGGCCGVKFDEPLTRDDLFYETAARRAGANRA